MHIHNKHTQTKRNETRADEILDRKVQKTFLKKKLSFFTESRKRGNENLNLSVFLCCGAFGSKCYDFSLNIMGKVWVKK